MTRAYYASILVSSTLFLFYGCACLFFEGMRRDFERFGLSSRLRTLVGTLEVLGALGLIVGLQVGWEAGIRTPITWSRATCPTVERPPSTAGRPNPSLLL